MRQLGGFSVFSKTEHEDDEVVVMLLLSLCLRRCEPVTSNWEQGVCEAEFFGLTTAPTLQVAQHARLTTEAAEQQTPSSFTTCYPYLLIHSPTYIRLSSHNTLETISHAKQIWRKAWHPARPHHYRYEAEVAFAVPADHKNRH